MPRLRILIVDDERGMLEVCADSLASLRNAEIVCETQGARARERLSEEQWDLLITDLRMPSVGGLALLAHAHQRDPSLPVLIMTAFPSVDTAVESMKMGAADYVIKPFLPDDLLAAVKRLLRSRQLQDENRLLLRQLDRAYAMESLLGDSPPMRALIEKIRRVAPTDADVLVVGETGTGKELVARSIHQQSTRSDERFVPIDCGAIPEELMESEFFGHERGAFTGAVTRSLGLLEFADGGTFFLDEIGELSQRLQAKLLRALQERRIRRVGGTQEADIDVRVIAATSRDLEEDVDAGRFRSDLYYRINVARIELAPLRDRAQDIPLLAEHFIDRYSREMGRPNVAFDPDALDALSNYFWPGNVRQLQNVIKQAIAMTRDEVIRPKDFPTQIMTPADEPVGSNATGFFDSRDRQIAEFEKGYLQNILEENNGNASAAADAAQMPRGTLYRLLKKHGLNAADFKR